MRSSRRDSLHPFLTLVRATIDTLDAEDETTYHAKIGDDRPRENPHGLVRRRVYDPTYDEAFTRSLVVNRPHTSGCTSSGQRGRPRRDHQDRRGPFRRGRQPEDHGRTDRQAPASPTLLNLRPILRIDHERPRQVRGRYNRRPEGAPRLLPRAPQASSEWADRLYYAPFPFLTHGRKPGLLCVARDRYAHVRFSPI